METVPGRPQVPREACGPVCFNTADRMMECGRIMMA